MTDALFDLDVPTPEPAEKLSATRKLTRRQQAQLAAGVHPLMRGPLHPDAAPAEPRDAPGLRCGGCKWRVGYRGYPKCGHPQTPASRGPATDVKAFWSACPLFEPRSDQERQ